MSRIHIVLVGGGTGGHFYPLISIAETLMRNPEEVQLYYMGPNPYDAQMLSQHGINFISCPAGKRRRYFSFLNFIDFFKTCAGFLIALGKLFYLYPDVIISKGGFTSVPVTLAGWLLQIPILVHESDSLPGSANKLAGRFARQIFISYKETGQYFKEDRTALVGIPIRKELRNPPTTNPHEKFGVIETLPIILVLGGSQGAERLNELILDSLDELLIHYTVIHQTGERHFNIVSASAHELIPDEALRKRYHPVPFLEPNTLNDALHIATLVISRAGSGTIHEIALHGKPAILIPIPENVSHDQRTNAFTYGRTGGAIVIEEGNFSDNLLMAEIERIIGNSAQYNEMSAAATAFGSGDAGRIFADIALSIGQEHH